MAYAVLDGFDLGVGAIHLWIARSEAERRAVLSSIGPVWDGNEVWLIAGGGVLFCAFPSVYASGFSGFYLPLMIVLWLLILRGIAIEFRNHLESLVWQPLWDVVFAAASGLLAVFFGAALGNVLRGVPLDHSGFFFLPLWTDLRISGQVGILDWFTIMLGLASLLTLVLHGALWLALKTETRLARRSRAAAGMAWWGVLCFSILIVLRVPLVERHLGDRFVAHPWGFVFPIAAGAALGAVRVWNRRGYALAAFIASSIFIAGMLSSAAFGLYPYLLPSNIDSALALTIENGSATPYGLRIGLGWFIPGIILAIAYTVFVYRHFSGKASIDGES